LTVASRLAGFGRILVFTATVGGNELGDTYQAANTIPNIIFELVAGGALASLVVPLLAGAAARGDRASVADTVSALLTWVVTLLVPVAVGVAIAAEPLVRLLRPDANPAAIAAGADMLRVFAPQLPLYGVGIVLTGVLQTYRRFAWPVLAPLLSSVTAVVAYTVFGALAGRGPALSSVSDAELLVLSVGTTLGVAVLSLCLLVPLRRLDLRLRPAYRLDASAARAIRPLALAGAVTVGAQQLSLGVAIALATPDGSVVYYTLAQTIFLLPWAVLALPVATTTYPALAEAAALGERERYARTLAPAVRSLLLLCCFGATLLVTLATPGARILAAVTADAPPAHLLADGIAGFAPGLAGYGLFALLSRALYARGAAGAVTVATALGWASVAGASFALSAVLPTAARVAALALANSVGMLVLGAALVVGVVRRIGGASLARFGRTLGSGILAATAATGAAIGLRLAVWGSTTPGAGGAFVQCMLGAVVASTVFGAVAAMTDRDDLRPLASALLRRRRRGVSSGEVDGG
jgi:putative peptidoglycan lipid II flippase